MNVKRGAFLIQYSPYLVKIEKWTEDKQMALNKSKTKYMVINFTKKFQFSTRIQLQNVLLEEVQECRLLGLTITNELSWDRNTENIIKNANKIMLMILKLYEFNIPTEDLVHIYILFIRSLVEYCCAVWHSSLTEEDSSSIERIQKVALRMILKEDYSDYPSSLQVSGLETIKQRRTQLSLSFAKKCLKSDRMSDLFPLNNKTVKPRPHEKYYVTPAKTECLAKSTVPYLNQTNGTGPIGLILEPS